MPQILDINKMPDAVKAKAKERGIDINDELFVYDENTGEGRFVKKSEQGGVGGILKTVGFDALEGLVPTAAGMATAAGATALAAPTTPLGQAAVAVPSAVGGGLLAQKAQQSLLEKYAPDYVTEQDIRRRANPIAATIGQTLAGFPFGMGYRGVAAGIRNLGAKEGAKQAVKMAAAPAVLGGALEAGSQLASEGEISPLRVGIAALGNVAQVDNTTLGNFAEAAGRKVVGKLPAKAPAVQADPMDVYGKLSKDIMESFRSGQLTEGSPLHKQFAEAVMQPDATVDHLVSVAQRNEATQIKNDPALREKLAGNIFDALQAGQDPTVLADSPVENFIKQAVKDGDIKTRAEAERVGRAAKFGDELNAIKRERAENAGPPPLQPGQRLADEQVDILLKTPPEVKPPNATKLDEAVMEGRKQGFVNSAQDVRFLEDAYLVNPENLPNAMRSLWEEKQLLAQGPTAADATAAFEARDTKFFAREFPKLAKDLELESANLSKIEAVINDKNAPETVKALNRSKLESARKALDAKWQKLLDKALEKYPQAANPLAVAYPNREFTRVGGTPPEFTGDATRPIIEGEIVSERTFPVAEPPPQGPTLGQGKQPAGLLGRGALVTPPPPTPRGLLGPTPEELEAIRRANLPVLERNPLAPITTKPEATSAMSAYAQDNPETRFSGLPPQTARAFGKVAAWIPKQVMNFIYEGTVGGKQLWQGTKPVLERIRTLGPSGEAIADADFKMRRDATKTFNTAGRLYAEAYAALDGAQTRRVNRFLNEMRDTGQSFIILTPQEKSAVSKIRRALMYIADNGIIRGGPGVREGALYREMKIDPNYIPTVADSKVRKAVQEGGPEAKKFIDDWNAWYADKLGLSQAEAEALRNEYLAATGSPDPLSGSNFNALTKAEGVGLPPSWRADTRKALMYHAFRAAKNFAWFTHVQKNPTVAKAVGVTDDGWGNQIDISNVAGDSVQNNPAVQAWVNEQNAHLNADEGMLERLNRIASAFQLGPLTGLRDLIATPAHLVELMPGEDMGAIMTALKNIMTKDVRADMERSGDIKNKNLQPFEFLAPKHQEEMFDRVVEAARFVNGRNKLESAARQWAYEIGRLVSQARLAKGDLGFFEKLKIPDWKTLRPEDLHEAVGSRFVENAQGNYSTGGLPEFLLSSTKKNAAWRSIFSLQRWGVERFNHWYKNAWQPAVEEGNFRPLLKSVFAGAVAGSAIEAMQELLFNQKPKEMTWKEFMRADNKELAYTLFSKLQNAGMAGMMSGLGLSLARVKAGEPPDEVRNLAIDMIGKMSTRFYQAANALAARGQSGFDVFVDLLDSIGKDQIQAYRLWMNRNRPDLGIREDRMMQRQAGKGGGLSASIAKAMQNPFDPMMDLRAAQTPEEIQKALPRIGRALQANPEYNPRIQSSLRALDEKPSYYDFVGQLQGPAAGQAALQRDLGQQQLSLLKKAELARLKWQTQIIGGPP